MIDVQHVSHHFGALTVLHDVSFHVPAGEVLGFIGPNGAGKTTTIRMLATLLMPDEGSVRVDGIDVIEDPRAVRRLIGFMPDSFGLYERITVDEYLEFFSAAHGVPKDARRRTVDAVMELTDLTGLRERLVAQMSKGMKQRLAIARMLLHDPKVLILDEPANGLDPRARIDMRELILELQRLGKTIIVSSHILSELSDMVSSVVILEKGHVLAQGKVDEIGRKLRPDRALRMRVLCPPPDLAPIFQPVFGVIAGTFEDDGSVRIDYRGDDQTVAEIVKAAVNAGLGVTGVEPEKNDLERIFLEITRGELQ